jgi:hypothetical protein
MNLYVHLWQYLAEFFLEWDVFQMQSVPTTQAMYV